MMKVHLITFGTKRYVDALNRLKVESAEFGGFESVTMNTPETLGKEFTERHRKFYSSSERQYKFAVWKPHIILQKLLSIPEGDVVLYIDAGCSLNSQGKPRFMEYLKMMEENDVLLFHLVPHMELYFTHAIALKALGFTKMKDLLTPQHVGGIHFWKNNQRTRDHVQLWLDWTCKDNYAYIINNDSAEAKSLAGSQFAGHRHDQSLLSVLSKKAIKADANESSGSKNCVKILSLPDETYPVVPFTKQAWKTIPHWPIWATRKF